MLAPRTLPAIVARFVVLAGLLFAHAASAQSGAPDTSAAGASAPAPPDSVPVPGPVPASLDTARVARDTTRTSPDTSRTVPDTTRTAPDTSRTVLEPTHPAGDTTRAKSDTTRASADTTAAPSPRWALVLSGGVARGIAHVGVLKRLEEEGLRPDLVVGSSMGALVAALYASGLGAAAIESVFTHTDWKSALDAAERSYGWRGATVPRPWFRLQKLSGGLGLPRGLLDDSYLNYALSASLLEGEAESQGDFRKLPIRLRVVATDLQTTLPVVLDGGHLGQAVRSSLGVPVFFPPVPYEGKMLGDGGSASNLPVGVARAAGVDRILAIDVAFPSATLDENSSAAMVGLHLFDTLNKRGQIADTLSSRDALLWLKLPGFSMWGFEDAGRLVEEGYRGSADVVRRFAARAGIGHSDSAGPLPARVLPPLARRVDWHDRAGGPAGRAQTARSALGRLPAGRFETREIAPALFRLYRANLFESAWPRLVVRGDSTVLDFEVREYPQRELDATAGYESDRGARAHASLLFRPENGPLPALMALSGRLDAFGGRLDGAAESTPLARGAWGWFARASAARVDTRLFDSQRGEHRVRTEREEALGGIQRTLPWGALLQAGAGFSHAIVDPDSRRQGLMLAIRADQQSRIERHFEITAIPGNEGYGVATGSASVSLEFGPVTVRPSVRAGLASSETPADELPALGGPESLAGLKHDEWRGREMLALDARAIYPITRAAEVHVFGQVGGIGDAVSRPDLTGSPRASFGLGGRVSTPFGPILLDWGFTDDGQTRTDFSFGPQF